MFVTLDLLLIISSALTVSAIFKDGSEYVYSYDGEMKIGTNIPSVYYSYSKIKADLHIKPFKNDLYLFLDNVAYSSYPGSAESYNDGLSINESRILTEPFIYHRFSNRSKTGISANKMDEFWSVKIKRAIASLLFLDKEELDAIDYGYCSLKDFMQCIAIKNDNLVLSGQVFSLPDHSDSSSERNPFSNRIYVLEKEKDEYIMVTVLSDSNYNYHQNFYVFSAEVKQSLKLSQRKISDLKKVDDKDMIYYEYTSDFVTPLHKNDKYMNNVRNQNDYDNTELKNLLEEVLEYLKNQNLNIKPSIHEVNALEKLINDLNDLDLKQLNNFYSLISDDSELSDFLLEMILLTNNPNAYCYIVEMIQSGKLNEKRQMNLITKMTSNPIPLTECLVNGLLKLSNDKSLDKIRHQALLTLGSMIRVSKEENKYDYIVKSFSENYNQSKSDAERAVYIHALFNVNSNLSAMILNQMALSEHEFGKMSGYIKALVVSSLKLNMFSDKMFMELINTDELNIEIKATVLNMLVNSLDIINMDNLIETLKRNDDDLYQLFYAKTKNFSNKKRCCYTHLLKSDYTFVSLKKPKKAPIFATIRKFEYENKGREFKLETTVYGSMYKYNFVICQFRLRIIDLYLNELTYELYVRITDADRFITHDKILKQLFKGGLKGQMFLKKDGFVISVGEFDLAKIVTDILKNEQRNYMNQLKNVVKYIPTEMGTTMVLSDRLICMENMEALANFNHLIFNDKQLCFNYYDFSAYNPIVNQWIGAKTVISAFTNIPIDIKLKTGDEKKKMKGSAIDLKSYKFPLGFQLSSRNFFYMKSEKGSRPKNDINNLVTLIEKDPENTMFLDEHIESLGLRFTLDVNNLGKDLYDINIDYIPYGLGDISLMIRNDDERANHLELHFDVNMTSLSDVFFLSFRDNFNLDYSVMSDDQVLESWGGFYKCFISTDISKCELKMVFKKEGVEDHSLNVYVLENFKSEIVQKSWLISLEDIVDGKTTETTKVFIINTEKIKGKMSPIINQERLIDECDFDKDKTFDDCLIDMFTYRSSTYNISYSGLSPKISKYFNKIFDVIKRNYVHKILPIPSDYKLEKDNIRVEIDRPVSSGVSVILFSPLDVQKYENVRLNKMISNFFMPPYSKLGFNNNGDNLYCEVGVDYVVNQENGDKNEIQYEDDWIEFTSIFNEAGKRVCSIQVKKLNENSTNLALRLDLDKDVILVNYINDFEIKLHENLLDIISNKLVKVGQWTDVMKLSKRVILHVSRLNLNIEFMKDRIKISVPSFGEGVCGLKTV